MNTKQEKIKEILDRECVKRKPSLVEECSGSLNWKCWKCHDHDALSKEISEVDE